MTKELTVGNTIPAGSIVLLTAGKYSDYGIHGLYRADTDVVIPGRPAGYGRRDELEPDLAKLSTLLVELPYVEVWSDD